MTTLTSENIMCRSKDQNPESLTILSLAPIQEITDETFKKFLNLIELDIQKNDIQEIKGNTFVGLNKLEKLNLRNCKIKQIEAGSFSPLINLKHLILSGNDLSAIMRRERVFHNLENLEILELENCNISSISRGTFKKLPKLHTLILSNNFGLNLTYTIFVDMPNLKTLLLNDCNIQYITDKSLVKPGKRNMMNLETLDLSNNAIKVLGEDDGCMSSYIFYEMDKLRTLNLSNNKIDIFCTQPFLKYLTQLELLNLSNNPIEDIIIDLDDADNFKKLNTIFDLTGCEILLGHHSVQVMNFKELFTFIEFFNKKLEKKRKQVYELNLVPHEPINSIRSSTVAPRRRDFTTSNTNDVGAPSPAINRSTGQISDISDTSSADKLVKVKTGVLPWNFKLVRKANPEPGDIVVEQFGGSETDEDYYKTKFFKYKHLYEKLHNKLNQK